MKKTLYLLCVPMLVCMAFIYRESSLIENTSSKTNTSKTTSSENIIQSNTQLYPAPQSNRFLFGAMDNYSDHDNNYTNYNNLGFNLWHTYNDEEYDQILDRKTPKGRISANDHLTSDVSLYSGTLLSQLNNIHTQQNNNSIVLWCRPKIEWLCYGQSSTYEAEQLQANDPLWFYSFNISNGSSVPDPVWNGGKYALHCSGSGTGQNAEYVLKNLKANTEQCRNDEYWLGDSKGEWIIKPRIRIPVSFVVPSNYETPVCRIIVYAQDGNQILKDIDIKVKYFRDKNTLQYDGSYIEDYNFSGDPVNLSIQGAWGDKWWYSARGNWLNNMDSISNHADIRVYWYDNCEMWIDYVKVENDIADELMNPDNPNHVRDSLWIKNEVEQITNNNPGALYKYYVEHFEFNNLPCVKYVNDKLKLYSGGSAELLTDFDDWYGCHLRWNQHASSHTAEYIYNNIISKAGFSTFFFESYPLTSKYVHNVQNITDTYCRIPITLPRYSGDSILAWPVSPADYETYLQEQLDAPYGVTSNQADYPFDTPPGPPCGEGPLDRDNGNFTYYMKLANEMQRTYGLTFINMPQAHQWFRPVEVRREPTNEELDLFANLPVSYGAKGLVYFYFNSAGYGGPTCIYYGKGMYDETGTLRGQNVYRETKQKWQQIKEIGERMQAWEPLLMNFNNSSTRSFTYYIESDRNAMYQNTYFSDVFTYKYGTGPYPCPDDYPQGDVPPNNTIGECKDERYLQVATFEKTNELNTNYFMIVNRRCSPHRPEISENGGLRRVKLNINPNSIEINRYNNWRIIDVENPLGAAIPYHRGDPYVDLGWFEPGQGKLYKMEPVIIKGGILTEDEIITDESFTCEAPVYNNGHNITIGANTTIHFIDSSRFVMNGGTFTVGNQNVSGSQNITCDAVNGSSWLGHSFTNCEVKIYGADFSGVVNDTAYAINVIDCPVVDIRNCTFNTNSSLKGGVNAICFDNPFIAINNIYIGSNTFNSSGSTIPTINVSSYAGVTTPLIIENNTFNEGNTAVFLTSVIGGAVKGNTITDNYIGINALTSSIDVVQNNISSTVNGSMGIFAAGGSELKLNSSGIFTLGGLNNISNEGTGTNNTNVDGSYFLLDDGENIFNISSDQSSYHLYGYFPMFTAVTTEETNNCFKVDDSPVDPPINMVTSGYQGSQITFNFIPYLSGCEIIGGGDGLAINLGDGIYDTIYTGGSGSGGSQSSVASVRRTDSKIPLSRGVTAEGSRGVFLLTSAKTKYDSISVLMRYRNYTQAKTKCLDLINTYTDSIQSIFAVSKLFLATVASDTSYNAVNTLKIFYENLILNHPGNTLLVKRANYYILKCKVRMREYSQALAGFQQIINGNPYSYEGLIARWDYMATSLLVQGQGGGEPSITNYELGITGDSEDDIDGNDDDKKPFTKEQRQDIRKSINTAIEISKNDDETKIKKLEEKSQLGDVNASKELTQMKSLKQVVKTEKPKSIIEHVRIVSEDIRKVFGSNTSSKGNEPKNIPLVFRISQNYPNPFNPVTKINYDLPRDSKVKIIIYDILGREVKRLVNNELKTAGSYIVDFNASNYASGVYFYRIEAEEPNGNKFVDSKKMVLLK